MSTKISLILCSFLILLKTDYTLGQEKKSTPYFPYQKGDILVYSVYDFDRNYLHDIKLSVNKDSLGEDGKRYLSSFLSGQEYSVHSSGDIYSDNYYDVENSRVFDSKALITEPWVLTKRVTGSFELAVKREILSIEKFGVQDTIVLVEYYLAPDSLDTSGLARSELQWSAKFGLLATFDAEGGNRHSLKGILLDGVVYGDTLALITAGEIDSQIPSNFSLRQNYPNPFNPSTTIQFELATPSNVSLSVYTIQGQLIQRLTYNQYYNAGVHSINLNILQQRTSWVSGLYFYELITDYGRQVKRMTLIK